MTAPATNPTASFSEIDHAIKTMDAPMFCNWCGEFSEHETKWPHPTCGFCESTDGTFSTEQLTIYLEEQAEAAWIAGQQAVERKSA